ncbi:P-loop NTPase fold protein [Xylanibacter muris]|uniref:KAP NTPase domain-containing protein n=1 Tax=Xylanibacter muris TaxID=2736290 RepID=A0ABX2AJX3_9BACT|nr:P-loop NTPase fold protein [Xylanibacter muris]NPD91370.1 hypothetical protein [Xylanibacter muris]
MNDNIVNFLNEYMINPDPQYAVLLKGKWGCGKTYFINSWIKEYQKKDSIEKVFEPVYVSLYGLSETQQITTAINRALYPILYCKAAKAGKTLVKFISGIVFKHEVDFNNDGNADITMSIGLDPLSIFKSEDEQVKKGNLLIFDDLERCDVPMKKLLGYLNYFVEQCHCHLLIIGDENKITESENRKVFGEFKEKTIGREFEIETDIQCALDCFVNQTPRNDFVINHQKQIEEFFSMTECNNLRILRQALWDFSRFEESMTDFSEDERYENIMIHVLGSYVISYCEYRGKNHNLLDKWIQYNFKNLQVAKEEINQMKSEIGDLHLRYNNIYQHLSNYQTFRIDLIERVILELNTGNSIRDYVKNEYFAPIEIHSWDRIKEAYTMSNEQFIIFYNNLIEDICNVRITSLKHLGYAIAYLVYLDSRAIKKFSDADFNKIREALPEYLETFKDEESVYNARIAFCRGIDSYMTNEKLELIPSICAKFNEEYENKLRKSKNLMTRTLEELSDSTVGNLCDLNEQAVPDHSHTYDMVSIFNHVDINILMNRLQELNNESLYTFNHFIRNRYKLSYNMAGWTNDTNDDIQPLELLKQKVDETIISQEYVRKEAFMYISKSLEGAIKRCKGDLHAMTF